MFRHLDHLVESISNVTRICDSINLALYFEDLLSCFESTEQSFLNIGIPAFKISPDEFSIED